MSTMTTVNTLPVPTWNHLGVNGARVPPFPTLQERKAFDLQIALPLSVEFKELAFANRGDDALEEYVYQNKNAQISINIGNDVKEPLHMRARLTKETPLLVESVHINVEENCDAKLFHLISSEKESKAFYAGLLKVHAEKNATVHITIAQLFDESVNDWSQLVIETDEGAHVEVVRVLLGAENRINAVRACLEGNNSNFALDTYYNVKDNNSIDVNDVVVHIGTNTTSNMYFGGILDGNGSKIYRGTIDFRKGAVKSIGKEIDDVLLMSPTVHNKTCPLILCGEESVAGEHAATIGRFNDEQLFYLCSRGLTVEQAKQLLVDAKLHNVVSKIQDETLQEAVRQFAKEG